jgi:magnesium transporter
LPERLSGKRERVETALLFARDEVEEVGEWPPDVEQLGRSSILWIDLDRPDQRRAAELSRKLELRPETQERLFDGVKRPYLEDAGSYVHVTALAPSRTDGRRTELVKVDCLVAPKWVVTVHDGPIAVLDEFRERACGGGETGRLDGLELVANLLEWVLKGYLEAFEDVELALEEFDTRAMEGELGAPDSELGRLVVLRHEVGALRRALSSHRSVLLALTRPELANLERDSHAERFETLRERLEEVMQAARDSRESVVGSFDVLIARTEQRTNEIMKVLTLVSALLLPGALVAGVLGMNFKIGLFSHAEYFWVVLGGIFAIAVATIAAARMRRWI